MASNFKANENQTNLIVNYLPQLYTDDEMFALFSSAGVVKNCKIIRDKGTGYSYGFGFVDFTTPEEAQLAIDTLNGYELENKHIKVALARPPGEQTKGANLYVRNIPAHYNEENLKSLFSSYGNIIQVRILIDHTTGNSKGVGFVLFELKDNADQALSEMNGYTPEDGTQAIVIKFADDNSKKVRAPMPQGGYGGGFGGGYGGPRPGGPMRGPGGGSRMRYNPMGVGGGSAGGSQGNGYGAYGGGYQGGYGAPRGRGAAGAGNPIRGAGYQQFGGGDAGQDESGIILFVYNIGNVATEHDMWNLFSPYGTIKKINVIWDHAKNQCKGYAFVTMATMEEAKYAIEYLNGFYFKTNPLQVSIKSDKQQ